MARIEPLAVEEAKGRAKEILEGPLKGKGFNVYRTLAHSPAALEGLLAFSGSLSQGELSAQEREVIALFMGERNGCDYCVAAHTKMAELVGMSDAEILAARRGEMDDARLTALLAFVRALDEKRGFVDDGDIHALIDAGYGEPELIEIVAAYGLNTFTNYLNHVAQTDTDFPPAPSLS